MLQQNRSTRPHTTLFGRDTEEEENNRAGESVALVVQKYKDSTKYEGRQEKEKRTSPRGFHFERRPSCSY
jgi:hypothetical protein